MTDDRANPPGWIPAGAVLAPYRVPAPTLDAVGRVTWTLQPIYLPVDAKPPSRSARPARR